MPQRSDGADVGPTLQPGRSGRIRGPTSIRAQTNPQPGSAQCGDQLGAPETPILGIYPFELWTLERLQRAFKERQGVHLSDSTIWTWMEEEGFQWKRQQNWFHEAEQHDPEFVEKRGA